MRGLAGKVALVTGGASGIGAAACRRLVAEGAKVAIGDLDGPRASALADELGDAAFALSFDAEDTESVRALVADAVERFGRLDVLFNNAALVSREVIRRDTNPVDLDFAIWDRTLAVNARGYLAGCKYAIPHLLAAGSGTIVMTASGSGQLGDLGNLSYAASKAAIMSLVRSVATQYGRQGIRCNAVLPGFIEGTGGREGMAPAIIEIMRRHTLTPRLGRPEDVAALVAWLCSDDAAFITGQAIAVDGGMLAHMPFVADFAQGNVGWS